MTKSDAHRSVLLLFCLLTFEYALGQLIVDGKILNSKNQEAIPYTNIGIKNFNIGTLSNRDGSFSISVPRQLATDSLTFCALGYEKIVLPISTLQKKSLVIRLDEKVTQLQPVTVSAKRGKNKFFELGNRTCKGGVIETDTAYAGRSIALLIENKESHHQDGLEFPVYLEKASLRIFRNNLASMKFRVRLNGIDSLKNTPGEDLLLQSIIVESNFKNGWLDFDLSGLSFIVRKPFFVTFEQILDATDRASIIEGYKKLMTEHPKSIKLDTIVVNGEKKTRQIVEGRGLDLPGTFVGISTTKSDAENFFCYVRDTSLGGWKKVRGILSATVTLSDQPSVRK